MFNELKNWIFNIDDQNERLEIKENMTLIKFKITHFHQLSEIGDAFKNTNILLCSISDEMLIRALDFISGLCFVLNYTNIKITDNDYLFIPHTITYISNS